MEGLPFPERGLIGGLDKIDWALADMMVVDAAFLMIYAGLISSWIS